MWVCVAPQSVACALAQGRLFCKVGFCASALCALQMCLTWCVGQDLFRIKRVKKMVDNPYKYITFVNKVKNLTK